MAKGKRSVRTEFIFWLVFIFILVFALLADWWKEHAVIGWTILGILVVVLIYAVYRFAKFRGWLIQKAKTVTDKVVYEDNVPKRELIPHYLYNKIMARAKLHCENPDCRYRGRPEIHHIDLDKNNNESWNLIALCPNCHADAHNGKLTTSQLRNFARYSSGRYG